MVRHVINKPYRLEAMKAYFDKLRTGLTIFYISIYPTAILVIHIGCINNQTYNLILTGGTFAGKQVLDDQRQGFLNDLLGTGKKPQYRLNV